MVDIIVTGFEPFGGESVNPSWEIARAVQADPPSGTNIHAACLPVDTQKIGDCLKDLITGVHPQALIMLGQAGGRPRITVERVAVNVLDFSMPDNSGRQVVDEPVVPGGPAAYFATLPIRAMVDAMNEGSIPAAISNSAGTYLCNQAMYLGLHYLAAEGVDIPAGFIHVPFLPAQACRQKDPAPSMTLSSMVTGIRLSIGRVLAGM